MDRRTFIQDVSEPLTGRIDQRKIAAKFNNLEHAVDELAERRGARRRREVGLAPVRAARGNGNRTARA